MYVLLLVEALLVKNSRFVVINNIIGINNCLLPFLMFNNKLQFFKPITQKINISKMH